MNDVLNTYLYRKMRWILTCLVLFCCLWGNVACSSETQSESQQAVTAQTQNDEASAKQKTENQPQETEEFIREQAEDAWKAARLFSETNDKGECNQKIVQGYQSQIQALEGNLKKLQEVQDKYQKLQEALIKKSLPAKRKMDEFLARDKLAPEDKWNRYREYPLLWRGSNARRFDIDEKLDEISMSKRKVKETHESLKNSLKTCQDYLTW